MKRRGRTILVGALAVSLLLAVQFASPAPGGVWLRTLYDSLHVPVFGVVAICILYLTPANWGGAKRILATTVAVIALGALSELAQIPTNRDASVNDLIADWLGAAGFVCIALVFARNVSIPRGRRLLLALLGIAFITPPLLPLAKVSAAYVVRTQSLPTLIRFDSPFARVFFRLQNAKLIPQGSVGPASASVDIQLGNGPWPGIVFSDLWPNWASYENLVIGIENPGADTLPVNLRVHDREHRREQRFRDRFNRTIKLAPGLHVIRISLSEIQDAPDGRQMNLSEIDGLVIFATRQEAGRRFVLHEIRLE
jgi:hypothetical protein